jgi:hypothetical protein
MWVEIKRLRCLTRTQVNWVSANGGVTRMSQCLTANSTSLDCFDSLHLCKHHQHHRTCECVLTSVFCETQCPPCCDREEPLR